MRADRLDAPLRVSEIVRRAVTDRDGRDLGRVADIETTRDADGRERVVALVVTAGRWGRLLGYERDESNGPWILEALARRVLRRHTVRVSWEDLAEFRDR
jgi:sporulation protein YlmC with PRC-barrel domain